MSRISSCTSSSSSSSSRRIWLISVLSSVATLFSSWSSSAEVGLLLMVFGKGTDPGWNLMVASRWMSSLTWLVDSCRAVRRSWIISNDDIVFYLRGGGVICSWARSWVVAASSINGTYVEPVESWPELKLQLQRHPGTGLIGKRRARDSVMSVCYETAPSVILSNSDGAMVVALWSPERHRCAHFAIQ